jgi:hypothetical protein
MAEDPLYDELAAKIEKECFPFGRPDAPPLQGVEEAVEIMGQVVKEKFSKNIQRAEWTFFDNRGEILSPPCAACGPKPTPLLSDWWCNVNKWSKKQKKRAIDMQDEEDEENFISAVNKHEQEVSLALKNAWKAKHPKLHGDWAEEGGTFIVEFK